MYIKLTNIEVFISALKGLVLTCSGGRDCSFFISPQDFGFTVTVHASVAKSKEGSDLLCDRFLQRWDRHKDRFLGELSMFVTERSRRRSWKEGWEEEGGPWYGDGFHTFVAFDFEFGLGITSYSGFESYYRLKQRSNILGKYACLSRVGLSFELEDGGEYCRILLGTEPVYRYYYKTGKLFHEVRNTYFENEELRSYIKALLKSLERIPVPLHAVVLSQETSNEPEFFCAVGEEFVLWRDVGYFQYEYVDFKYHHFFLQSDGEWRSAL